MYTGGQKMCTTPSPLHGDLSKPCPGNVLLSLSIYTPDHMLQQSCCPTDFTLTSFLHGLLCLFSTAH